MQIDPRAGWSVALAHAVSTRGADHLEGLPMSRAFGLWSKRNYGRWDDAQVALQVGAVIFSEHLHAIIDSIGLCKNDTWTQCDEGPGLIEFAEMLTTATGLNYTANQLLTIGERIYNLERAFNAREGLSREDDTFPEKFFTEHIGRIKLEKGF